MLLSYRDEEYENDRIDAQARREEERRRDERRYSHGMMQDEGVTIVPSSKPFVRKWIALELGVTAEQIEAWDAIE